MTFNFFYSICNVLTFCSKRKEYALKIISKVRCVGKEQMIENEVSILRRVKHPNIIQLIEEYDTPQELYLVMEYVRVSNHNLEYLPFISQA